MLAERAAKIQRSSKEPAKNIHRGNSRRVTATDGTYQITGLDRELWKQAKSRATLESLSMRELILSLLRHYAAKGLPK